MSKESPHILIVEDDKLVAGLIIKKLKKNGFRCSHAENVPQAASKLASAGCDLMLLDYILPKMNGDEFLERLEKKGLKPPFVAMTANGDEQTAVRMMRHGALDYCIKGANFIELIPAVIEKALLHIRQEQRIAESQAALKKAHDELETRVRERTRELEEVNERLRSSEDRFRCIFNAVSEGLLVLQGNGRIIMVNPAAAAMLKESVSRLVGRSFPVILSKRYQPLFEEFRRDIIRNGEFEREAVVSCKDDSLVEVNLSGTSFSFGESRHMLIVMRDISKQREAESNLRNALDVAEKANLAKSLFISNITHELRTPLYGITGFSDLLEEAKLPNAQMRHVKQIQKNAGSLLEIVNNILNLSELDTGKMSVTKSVFNVESLVLEVIESVEQNAGKQSVKIETDIAADPGDIFADRDKIRQILTHLVGNANKFTSKGSVRVRVEVPHRGKKHIALNFQVSDTGTGIGPEHLSRIFAPFEQADTSHTRLYGGTGLGLTLCKHLCQILEGELEVESTPGKGSTFTLKLEVEPA